jgi:hypothetical protein
MACSTFGPTSRAAQPCQAASSTSLGSNRVRTTEGSRAAAAMRSWATVDLPAPGSPPRSRLRSGNSSSTWLPSSSSPTGIGAHGEQRPALSSGQAMGWESASGSRRRTTTRA